MLYQPIFVVASALVAFAWTVSGAVLPPRTQMELERRANTSSSSFAFTNIVSATTDFYSGVTASIPAVSSAVLTNNGDTVSAPISGTVGVGGTNYTVEFFTLTTPAIFLLDGEFNPSAFRIDFKEGPSLAFLFILTPDEPDTPVINTALSYVGSIPSIGDTVTLPALDFSFFIETFIVSDIFYNVEAGGKQYFVRQLPLSMQLVGWRALKKVITVEA